MPPRTQLIAGPRKRRRLSLATALVVLAAGGWYVVNFAGEWGARHRYLAAAAEADRLDPGWRLRDLEARRPAVADASNSALVVLEVDSLPMGDPLSALRQFPADPGASLEPKVLQAWRALLLANAEAIAKARRLGDMPTGRVPGPLTYDLPPLLELMRKNERVSALLRLDALVRAYEGDIDGAIDSTRAVLNAGRSFGDSVPLAWAVQRTSRAIEAVACLEKVLGRGVASEAALARMQAAFEAEAKYSFALDALRAERALIDERMRRVVDGEESPSSLFEVPSRSLPRFLLGRRIILDNRARILDTLNGLVQTAKLPEDRHAGDFRMSHERFHTQWRDRNVLGKAEHFPSFDSLLGAENVGLFEGREKAALAIGIAAIAAERYRLADGHLPATLDALVPRYLARVPLDPWTEDSRTVRIDRQRNAWFVYSEGQHGVNRGGVASKPRSYRGDPEVLFQLLDPSSRGR